MTALNSEPHSTTNVFLNLVLLQKLEENNKTHKSRKRGFVYGLGGKKAHDSNFLVSKVVDRKDKSFSLSFSLFPT